MLGKNIKELRIERGLSQAQLAELIGVTQGAIYFWEKGINEPTSGYLIKLAKIFSVSVDELLSFEKSGEDRSLTVNELIRLSSKLSVEQQEILLKTAREFIKSK